MKVRIFLIAFLNGVWASSISMAQVIPTTAPFDYGTGALGNVVISSSQSLAGGVYNYHHLTINSGVVVTVTGLTPLVIKCTGTATINGKITAAGGIGSFSVLQNLNGQAGGSGAGGGGQNGGEGGTAVVQTLPNATGIVCPGYIGSGGTDYPGSPSGSGGSGGASDCSGFANTNQPGWGGSHHIVAPNPPTYTWGPTNAPNTNYGDSLLTTVLNGTNLLGGSGGGGAGAWCTTAANNSSTGGAGGGGGGGAFSITAQSLVIGSSALLTVKGGKGGSGVNTPTGATLGMAGGGGGAGGTILLQYHNITLPNSGTTLLSCSGTSTVSTNTDPLTVLTSGIDYSGGSFATATSGGRNGGAGSYGFFLAQCDSVLQTGLTGTDEKFIIEIYPNPLTSTSILHLPAQIKNAEVVIYDMLGKEMVRKKMDGERMEIEKGSLESGVYFVRVRSEERQWVEKIVIE